MAVELQEVVRQGNNLVLRTEPPHEPFTHADYDYVAQRLFPDFRVEFTTDHQIIVMAPTGGEISSAALDLATLLKLWAWKNNLYKVVGADTSFLLPNGAVKGPDTAVMLLARWMQMPLEVRISDKLPIVPDFIAEVRSKTDRRKDLMQKMEEWIANGVQLGWLIDPLDNRAYVYRPGKEAEEISDLSGTLSGEPVLPGFGFDLTLMRLA